MKRWFAIIAAAQILFLGAQAAYYELWKATGEVVEIRVTPVDPRSLFLGNYLSLEYDISRPRQQALSAGSVSFDRLADGATIFVELEPRKGGAVLSGLYARRPNRPAEGRVYLRGRKDFDRIIYGLERYYIPEARSDAVSKLQMALAREENPPRLTVEVAISRSGQGMIRRVLVDGKPLGF
ncbi:MAG: hypothetical protein KatS3mg024_0206 [Armatimonadota bacterium]|nr:MAG: hypothetical protein KatS3mg024_0206 [Armatimonadota bacterium]